MKQNKQKEQYSSDTVRTTLTLPKDLWDRISQLANSARPKLSANQVAVMMLDYAAKDIPKIEFIFKKIPASEGKTR